MNAVLGTGASQLGLTTTILPVQETQTLPILHQHARLHNQLIERRKLDQIPQYDEMEHRVRHHKPRRRHKRQHRLRSGIKPRFFHVEAGGGYHLRMHQNGTVDGEPISNTPSVWCLLKLIITAVLTNDHRVTIKGEHSNLYLCMNSSGIPYGSRTLHEDDCYFFEEESGTRYYYVSATHGIHSKVNRGARGHRKRWKKEWLLGLNSNGTARPGYRTSKRQRFGAFIVYSGSRRQQQTSSIFDPSVFGNIATQPPPLIVEPIVPPRRHQHGSRRRGECGRLPRKRQRQRCRRRRRQKKRKQRRNRLKTTTLTPLTPSSTPVSITTVTIPTTVLVENPDVVVKPTVASKTITPPIDLEVTTERLDTTPELRTSKPARSGDILQGLTHFNQRLFHVIAGEKHRVSNLAKQLVGNTGSDSPDAHIQRERSRIGSILAQRSRIGSILAAIRQSSPVRTKRDAERGRKARTHGYINSKAPFRLVARHSIPDRDITSHKSSGTLIGRLFMTLLRGGRKPEVHTPSR